MSSQGYHVNASIYVVKVSQRVTFPELYNVSGLYTLSGLH